MLTRPGREGVEAGAWAAFADVQAQLYCKRRTADEAVVAVCFCPASISGRASDEKGVSASC